MLDKLNITTNNFYKFLTTLSLVAFLYCSSFDTLFLSKYNIQITANNIETSKLGSERGYLTGVSKDLLTLLPDSVIEHSIQYFYFNSKDTSESGFYYRSIGLEADTKKLVDSLNIINRKLAEKVFIIKTIQDANKANENNIKVRGWVMNIFGIISFMVFLFGLFNWHKLKDKIDT